MGEHESVSKTSRRNLMIAFVVVLSIGVVAVFAWYDHALKLSRVTRRQCVREAGTQALQKLSTEYPDELTARSTKAQMARIIDRLEKENRELRAKLDANNK